MIGQMQYNRTGVVAFQIDNVAERNLHIHMLYNNIQMLQISQYQGEAVVEHLDKGILARCQRF